MQTQDAVVSRPRANPSSPRLDLNALARRGLDELRALYDAGKVADVAPLAGHPRGRMLAVRGLDRGPIAGFLRSFAGADGFPWGGKSFWGQGASGTGANRVHLGGRHQLFPFHTYIGASKLDGAPAIILNYDLPDNPGLIRSIHDEVREVDEGLFLGPAMWKTKGEPVLVLWFALDTHVQAVPIGGAVEAR